MLAPVGVPRCVQIIIVVAELGDVPAVPHRIRAYNACFKTGSEAEPVKRSGKALANGFILNQRVIAAVLLVAVVVIDIHIKILVNRGKFLIIALSVEREGLDDALDLGGSFRFLSGAGLIGEGIGNHMVI